MKKKMTEALEGDMEITAEQLQEALSSNPDLLVEALGGSLQTVIDARVQEALQDERIVQEAERDAVMDRQWELRDLRDTAYKMIAESKLPDTWREGLQERFTLREDRTPTAELDVVDDIDAEGKVTKTATEKLRESVETACNAERRRLAEVAPTRVRGQGPGALKEGENADAGNQPAAETPYWKTVLSEASINPDTAFAA
jgi:hypothetical protein